MPSLGANKIRRISLLKLQLQASGYVVEKVAEGKPAAEATVFLLANPALTDGQTFFFFLGGYSCYTLSIAASFTAFLFVPSSAFLA